MTAQGENGSSEQAAEPRPKRSGGYAAALAGLVALTWFLSRTSQGVSSGPWQALFLLENPPFSPPLLSWLAGRAVCWVAASHGPTALNVLAAVTGAAVCAEIAHLVANVAQRRLAWATALTSGIVAGTLFAFTPAASGAATGAHPAMLTVALALGAVSALVSAKGRDRSPLWYVVSGLFAGLAAANHPSFAVLVVILMAGSVLMTPDRNPATGMVLVAVGFFASASLPLLFALGSGESSRHFLSHALSTRNAAWGALTTERFFIDRLGSQFGLVGKSLVVFAPAILFRPGYRHLGIVLAAVVVCFGPLLPALTGELPWGAGLPDPAAPMLLVLAACVVASVCGLAMALDAIRQTGRARTWAVVALLLTSGVGVAYSQTHLCPNRRHDMTTELSEAVFGECPENAVLVSGDATLTSILLVAQHSAGLRPDVVVVPVQAVWSPTMAGARLLAERGVRLNTDFPSDEAVQRWEREQPVALSRALEEPDERLAWRDLALWEFVRTNLVSGESARGLCFSGVDSEWLAARGSSVGTVTLYPRHHEVEAPQRFRSLAAKADRCGVEVMDPDLAHCLSRALLVQSERARRQTDPDEARRLARLAARLAPHDLGPTAALMRAAARAGDQQEVARLTETYATLAAGLTGITPEEAEALAEATARDLDRYALAGQFALQIVGYDDQEGDGPPPSRSALAARLWAMDELAALAEGYGFIVSGGDETPDTCYEWAAALAQLGDLDMARKVMKPMFENAPEETAKRLKEDGRFALLLLTAEGDGGSGGGGSRVRL
jgi:hypothetical protein